MRVKRPRRGCSLLAVVRQPLEAAAPLGAAPPRPGERAHGREARDEAEAAEGKGHAEVLEPPRPEAARALFQAPDLLAEQGLVQILGGVELVEDVQVSLRGDLQVPLAGLLGVPAGRGAGAPLLPLAPLAEDWLVALAVARRGLLGGL